MPVSRSPESIFRTSTRLVERPVYRRLRPPNRFRIQVGIGTHSEYSKEFARSLKATNNLTDVAINGDGFSKLAVNGTTGYTREVFHG